MVRVLGRRPSGGAALLSANDLVVFKLSLNRLKDWADVDAMVPVGMLIDPEDVEERPVAFRGPTMCPRMAHLAPATGSGLTQQGGSRLESAGCDGPPDPAAALLTLDEARLGEDLGVVRDGRLAPVERALQVAAAGLTLGGDDREEPQPDGVAECGEDLGRLFRGQPQAQAATKQPKPSPAKKLPGFFRIQSMN